MVCSLDEELIAEGFMYIDAKGKKCLSSQESPEKQIRLDNFKSADNGVMILGFPKSGSHLMFAIIDELGVERIANFKEGEEAIPGIPLEFMPTSEKFDIIEEKLHGTDKLMAINHCHLPASHFQKHWKGKILYVTRDPRAVACSAFAFLGKLPFMQPYRNKHGLTDENVFARHFLAGKHVMGDPLKYDKEWIQFIKENPQLNVLRMSYEDIMADKPGKIKLIAEFLGIKDYDLDQVVKNTSIDVTREKRKKKFDDVGKPFFEQILYNKGKTNTWESKLNKETLDFYDSLSYKMED